MNITYNWLKEFVPFTWTVDELRDKLTFSGVEVEAVTDIGGGDFRLELEVTPNRPDCLSLLGLAREISALSGLKIDRPDCAVAETGPEVNTVAKVRVEDTTGCPRYVARVITGVTVAESPEWLKTKLTGIGLRPVNNVADITNLVLYELGHPLHAFDLDKVSEKTIVVRRAKAGEALTTIDGVERKLDAGHLVIADAQRPVGLAGIMGGLASEISSATKDVLLESAYFEPSLIRRESHGLGLKTDASYRFERGADPNGLERAADRCARLIAEHCGGAVAKGVIDVSARKYSDTTLTLRPGKANRLLGIEIPPARMAEILSDLELDTQIVNGAITATIPTFRRDLEREADLIEEVGRIHGYDKLPDDRITPWAVPGLRRPQETAVERVAQAMAALGFCEHCGLTLADPARIAAAAVPGGAVTLANPLSSDLSVLRPSLLPGLLEAAARNLNNGIEDVRLFEAGLVFAPAAAGLPQESPHLAAIVFGRALNGPWDQPNREYDFYDLKGAAAALFGALRLDAEVRGYGGAAAAEAFLHPGRSAGIFLGGAKAGCLGELAPAVARAAGIKGRGQYLELALGPVIARLAGRVPQFSEPPRFPAAKRDLALVVRQDAACAELEAVIREAGGAELEAVRLFDRYQGAQVKPGHTSMAFALTLRAAGRTMTDAEADAACGRIVAALKERTGAEVRTS